MVSPILNSKISRILNQLCTFLDMCFNSKRKCFRVMKCQPMPIEKKSGFCFFKLIFCFNFSMRHSLPSPVVEAGTPVSTSQQKPPPPGIEPQPSQPPLPQQTNKQQQQPSIKSSSSRKSKTNKGQKISKQFFSCLEFFQKTNEKTSTITT